jgi:DNA-directed RNA polymerase subunit RPC12/RpoP
MIRTNVPKQPPQPIPGFCCPEFSCCEVAPSRYWRLESPVPGIETVLTNRPRLSRPMRKPRNPHEYPSPLLDRLIRKPPGSRFDFLNLQANCFPDLQQLFQSAKPDKTQLAACPYCKSRAFMSRKMSEVQQVNLRRILANQGPIRRRTNASFQFGLRGRRSNQQVHSLNPLD